eukprot:9714507-Karenia_brevis.AAC.1
MVPEGSRKDPGRVPERSRTGRVPESSRRVPKGIGGVPERFRKDPRKFPKRSRSVLEGCQEGPG